MKNIDIFLTILAVIIIYMYFFYMPNENFLSSSKIVCGDNMHETGQIIRCPSQCPKSIKIEGGTKCVEVKKKQEPITINGICGDNKHGPMDVVICPDECKYKKKYLGGTICNEKLPPLVAK